MKYYIITGESSGDLHGSNLMKSIIKKDPNYSFRFWGGDQMMNVADGLVTHIKETAIMGFIEVVKNLPKILSFFDKAKESIKDFAPDAIILMDYSGFNLRMAKWAKLNGYKVIYYISPQLWAWKKRRVKDVKKYVDEMIVILPFEEKFYADHQIKAHYVGHPLKEVIRDFIPDPNFKSNLKSDKEIIALLPGSRRQEISKMLPIFIEASLVFKGDYDIVLAAAPHIEPEFYSVFLKNHPNVKVVNNDTYNLLSVASYALVTSGTATLETALFNVPQVVCYKTSNINYQIGKRLITLDHICIVNLILSESLVPELIQADANPKNLTQHLKKIISNKKLIQDGYTRLADQLAQSEKASDLAAQIVIDSISTID